MYYRSSLSVVNLCQFLLELCPFWNLKYCKYTVFRTFLLHALTYWVEILHMTFFYCTTDQVRVSSIFVWAMPLLELRILKIYSFPHFLLTCFDLLSWKIAYGFVFSEIKINFDCRQFASIFCGSYVPFGTLNTWNTQFTFLLHALAYWAEIFHVTFFNVLQIKFECCHSVSIHFIWNLKFDVGFFKCISFSKVFNKNSLLKCSWRAYYAPFAVLRYICKWFLSIDNSVRRLLLLKIVLHSLFADAIDGLRPNLAYTLHKKTFFPFRTGKTFSRKWIAWLA